MGEELNARVRFAKSDEGRLEPIELHVGGTLRLTGEILRTLRMGQFEAWANGRGRESLLAAIEANGGDLTQVTDDWCEAVGGDGRLDEADVRRLSLIVKRPNSWKLPDSFYADVFEKYTRLASAGSLAPAKEIADANGEEVTTVHRWVREARRRDKSLPRPGRGRRG
jgi:hypothetical protein